MKDLMKRISVALWGIPLLVYICYLGGYFFLAFVVIVNVLALWEFYKIFEEKNVYAYRLPGVIAGSLLLILTFLFPQYWQMMVLLSTVFFLIWHLRPPKEMASANTVYTISGFFYIPVLLSALLLLRMNFESWQPAASGGDAHAGGWFIVVMFAAIWVCDTAAYFGGRLMGKHKLAPNVSPNKTIEGAAWGFLFGVASFVGFGKLFLPEMPMEFAAVAGAIVGTIGQLGDLVESRFKRDAGVKDTSALLPGHGGFLDRFDSIIFVSPCLWALAQLW